MMADSLRWLNWKTMAWNRLGLEVPAGWEICRMGRLYLMLESGGRPVMEMKWISAGSGVSLPKVLRAVNRYQSRSCPKAQSEPIPARWNHVAKRFDDALGFRWTGTDAAGRGMLLSCRKCGGVILIQFLLSEAHAEEPVHTAVLNSLVDQCGQDRILWKVYDISAVIPAKFRLADYQFRAGSFQLSFTSSDKEKLVLHRWGPASYYLRRMDLAGFAESVMHIPPAMSRECLRLNPEMLQWSIEPPMGWISRLGCLAGAGKISRYRYIRVWHQPAGNRLLAVELLTPEPSMPDLFNRICCRYECQPQTKPEQL